MFTYLLYTRLRTLLLAEFYFYFKTKQYFKTKLNKIPEIELFNTCANN